MDAHEVSAGSQEHIQLLRSKQRALQEAQSRKGQKPAWTPRILVIQRFNIARLQRLLAAHSGPETFEMKSSYVPPPYPPCLQSLSSLKKIMIKDLLLETHHKDSYLLVRTVTDQDVLTAVMAIVEDEKGSVTRLQLYHQQDTSRRAEQTEEVLRLGQTLIIKEPYLKVTADGAYGLRVDHLPDVIFLPDNDTRIPRDWQHKPSQSDNPRSPLIWKTKGNEYFKKSEYCHAIECYTRALASSPTSDEARTLTINRSLAFLRTKQFDSALLDADAYAGPTDSEGHGLVEKALFRKGEALYNLRRHKECCEVLKKLRLQYPNNMEAKTQLSRAISRLAEQTHGKYRFNQLLEEASKLRPPHLDHATFLGPVAVRPSGSKGRGLFTTKAVKAGDLLFCEKAFTHAFAGQGLEGGSGRCDMTILVESDDRMTIGAHADLINITIRKLYNNPSLLPIIADLYRGSYESVDVSEVDGKPVVDSFLIRRIISLNSFGSPSTATSCLPNTPGAPASVREETVFGSCGIWPTASYINHSCTSNARRSFIGDMMIARATQDLAPDTEITWWYYPPVSSVVERQKKLKHWGFTCACPMCEDDRNTTPAAIVKRKTLVDGLMRYLESPLLKKNIVAKVEAFLKAMSETYNLPASDVPRLALWEALQHPLMKVLQMGPGQIAPIQTAKLIVEALTSLGYIIDGAIPGSGSGLVVRRWGLLVDGVVSLLKYLSDIYCLIAPQLVEAADGYARTTYRMVNGEDETFSSFGE
ncbi:TPR domain protein [Naviculisporaceae sp. PSN 640]